MKSEGTDVGMVSGIWRIVGALSIRAPSNLIGTCGSGIERRHPRSIERMIAVAYHWCLPLVSAQLSPNEVRKPSEFHMGPRILYS